MSRNAIYEKFIFNFLESRINAFIFSDEAAEVKLQNWSKVEFHSLNFFEVIKVRFTKNKNSDFQKSQSMVLNFLKY